SGYEITPIVSIDRFPLGNGEVGPITKKLSRAYMDLVRGIDRRHPEWRTPVYKPMQAATRYSEAPAGVACGARCMNKSIAPSLTELATGGPIRDLTGRRWP